MELERNGVREKSFLGVLVFGHPYCSSIDSTHFNVEHENTCSFLCHIGSSILTFRDMYLHVIVRKKNCFIIFCIKLTIYKKFFKKNSYKNLFFILPLYYPSMETLYPKKKSFNIFPTRNFC